MKNGYLKRFAAGTLVAVMAVAGVPAVSQTLGTTVVAEAKSKAEFYFAENGKYTELGVGKQTGYYFGLFGEKKKAKYSFTTNNKNLKVTRKKNGDFVVTAKKAGTYKVTAKEKYKGRASKVGSVKVKVYNQKVNDYTAYVEDDSISVFSFLEHPYIPHHIRVTSGKDLIKYDHDSSDEWFTTQGKEGTATLEVTDGFDKNPQTVTITIKRNNCTGVTAGYEYGKQKTALSTYVGRESEIATPDDYILLSDRYSEARAKEEFGSYEEDEGTGSGSGNVVSNDPDFRNYSDIKVSQPVTMASDNEAVATVRYGKPTQDSDDDDYDDYDDYDDDDKSESWYLKGVSAGTANITISCNGHSLTLPVTVYASSDEQ